jgi:hypothetical protein
MGQTDLIAIGEISEKNRNTFPNETLVVAL